MSILSIFYCIDALAFSVLEQAIFVLVFPFYFRAVVSVLCLVRCGHNLLFYFMHLLSLNE